MLKPDPLRWPSNLTCLHKSKKRDFQIPHHILMTDDNRLGSEQSITLALQRMPPQSAVIVRSKDLSRLKSLAKNLRPICAKLRIFMLAATKPSIASLLDVDGIHLSESDTRFAGSGYNKVSKKWIITAAAHSIPSVIRARNLGADVILISPVFPTQSHPGQVTLGSIGYRSLARHAPLQACPLGGLTALNIRKLKGAPMVAIAGIGLYANN